MKAIKHEVIIIGGAPGSGKSEITKLLQERLSTPMFEFCWIPEFRNTGTITIPYEEEEGIAFENLVLVTKNYIRHGYKNILLTDLIDKRILELEKVFSDQQYLLITLVVESNAELKSRVLNETRSSKYRNWEEAIQINQTILDRPLLQNEVRIKNFGKTKEEVVAEILALL